MERNENCNAKELMGQKMSQETTIRINKYLAECGVCSRRNADRYIEEGKVTIDGITATLGSRVTGDEDICLEGQLVARVKEKVIFAFYKPVGVVVTEHDEHAKETVMDYLDYPERLTYAGRLDKDSEGLLLLTNDGDFIQAAMKGANGHEKEYQVRLDKEVTKDAVARLSKGIYIKDLQRRTKPCVIEKTGRYTVKMILTEGLNRQIRRMWKAIGYEVKTLKRTRVLNVTLGNLKPGESRQILGYELEKLRELTQ